MSTTLSDPTSDGAAVGHDQHAANAIPDAGTDHSQGTVVVGIPAFNEAGRIGAVVAAALEYADMVLLVDDGSEDDTATEAAAAGALVVQHEANRGYGGALKTLFQQTAELDADRLVIIDADGQHDPADIPLLLDAQGKSSADIVIGSRFVTGSATKMPVYRRFGLTIINLLMNLSIGSLGSNTYIRDTQSGFRLYSRRAIESLAAAEELDEGMSASTDIIFHARRRDYVFDEVPTTVSYDVENAHSQNPVSHGVELVQSILFTALKR